MGSRKHHPPSVGAGSFCPGHPGQGRAVADSPEESVEPGCRVKMISNPDIRLVKLNDVKTLLEHSVVVCLPDGFVLIDPTPTEQAIISLYASEFQKAKPGLDVSVSK